MKNKSFNKNNNSTRYSSDKEDNNTIQVLYFNYKSYMNEVYKVKETGTGAEKIIPKDDTFNPPQGKEGGYSRMLRSIECLYDGAMILGTASVHSGDGQLVKRPLQINHHAPNMPTR